MAFHHSIDIAETGVAAEYWRLTHLQADLAAGVVEVQVHGYRDEAARRAARSPLSRLHFSFPAEAVMPRGNLSLKALYAALRGTVRFEDARNA